VLDIWVGMRPEPSEQPIHSGMQASGYRIVNDSGIISGFAASTSLLIDE
jgi:hypothetical protein